MVFKKGTSDVGLCTSCMQVYLLAPKLPRLFICLREARVPNINHQRSPILHGKLGISEAISHLLHSDKIISCHHVATDHENTYLLIFVYSVVCVKIQA